MAVNFQVIMSVLDELRKIWDKLFPPCIVLTMRDWVGLAYGSPEFKQITEPYWSRGYGTTCAVVLGAALEKCKWPGPLNRGQGWKTGAHMSPIVEFSRGIKGALEYAPKLDILVPGDILYLEGSSPERWHVGVLETNKYPHSLVTLDGGQTDSRGEQSINRVVRPIRDGKVGPYEYRTVKFVIHTSKIL